ncbi:hypothetical protein Pan241w_43720 [Gimesia alba]|uniref:GYF domain-containing protein n=1 Tax=Gimesia alba TaxID=2527973 RepID=A0A517RK88_9PLAN|nr:DUF4339 domain-containing protein [Gimesia alba]QDT44264.1 hypothetical protein Pan241w_43720 [Gimesia alba]
MATEWYYKQSDEALGPYSFREMVEMVREEQLLPETMVRPNYLDEWQRADSVVGLFHMARRDPATLPPVRSAVDPIGDEFTDADDLDAFLAESDDPEPIERDVLHEQVEQPGWLRRLLTLRNSKIPPVPVDREREFHVDLNRTVTNDEVADSDLGSEVPLGEVNLDAEAEVGAYSEETWASTVNAAVERIDARAPKQETPLPSRQIVPTISLSFLQNPVFRKLIFAGAIILCASAGIYGFVSWVGQGKLYFPLVGSTSPLLFLVYSGCSFLAVFILGPLLAYIAAPYLRVGFRVGAAVITANITVLFLLNWSEKQNMIFPSRKPTEAKLIFPIIGECSSFAYWMYFVDSVIFVAVLTYFAAWWLEAHADEV